MTMQRSLATTMLVVVRVPSPLYKRFVFSLRLAHASHSIPRRNAHNVPGE